MKRILNLYYKWQISRLSSEIVYLDKFVENFALESELDQIEVERKDMFRQLNGYKKKLERMSARG